jgi:hypothetical protein
VILFRYTPQAGCNEDMKEEFNRNLEVTVKRDKLLVQGILVLKQEIVYEDIVTCQPIVDYATKCC